MKQFLFVLISTYLMIMGINVKAQDISNLKLEKKISILNGRVEMMFPMEALKSEGQGNIMGPRQNEDNECSIIITIGKAKLFVFANELFIKNSTKDILDYTNKETSGKYINKFVKNDGTLKAVSSFPLKVDYTQKAILLSNLIVECKDHSLIRISTYINNEGIIYQEKFSELTEKIFSTIEAGSRILNLEKRIVNYKTFNVKTEIKISIPENYAFYVDKGADFEIIRIIKTVELDEVENSSIAIYFGDHPSYFYNEYQLNANDSVVTEGVFLGKKISWLNFSLPDKNFYLREQQIPCPQISNRTIIHVSLVSNKASSINNLNEILEKTELIETP